MGEKKKRVEEMKGQILENWNVLTAISSDHLLLSQGPDGWHHCQQSPHEGPFGPFSINRRTLLSMTCVLSRTIIFWFLVTVSACGTCFIPFPWTFEYKSLLLLWPASCWTLKPHNLIYCCNDQRRADHFPHFTEEDVDTPGCFAQNRTTLEPGSLATTI